MSDEQWPVCLVLPRIEEESSFFINFGTHVFDDATLDQCDRVGKGSHVYTQPFLPKRSEVHVDTAHF